MSMKRTNVYADREDLALIKDAARRRGIPEAPAAVRRIVAARRWHREAQ